jgi:hypothetical protein
MGEVIGGVSPPLITITLIKIIKKISKKFSKVYFLLSISNNSNQNPKEGSKEDIG